MSDPNGSEFFEKQIRPILVENCYKCHSKGAEKVKGGLLLDSREGVSKGGDSGAVLVPGEPEKSLLIKAVRYTDENLQMPPPKGGAKKLSAEQISSLEAWVKMGAPDPRTASEQTATPELISAKARAHWAFQPVHQPSIPRVQNQRWVQTPADAFVLAKLESRNLNPSPRADKRTLIRRATFDLLGLPPSPAQVQEFIADKAPDAYEKLIERLLASPQYGERWGRHWLDVARYADSKGYVFEEERRYPYAYTYRDYVIRAFNEDLPFDRFLSEQVAADLLELGEDKRALAALGYLTLGRRFVNNIHDIIDDRIDVVCRGMMGLTVSCARCHDHKYDPIPTKDYYSLYGVFASSTEPGELPLLGIAPEPKAHEEYLAEHKKRVEERDNFKQTKLAATAARLRQQTGEFLLAVYDAGQLTNKSEGETLAHKRHLDPTVFQRWRSSLEAWGKTNHPVFTPWFSFTQIPEAEFTNQAKALIAGWTTPSGVRPSSGAASGSGGLGSSEGPLNSEVAAPEDGRTPLASLNPIVLAAFSTNLPISIKEAAERYGKIFAEVEEHWQTLQTNSTKQKADQAQAPKALPDAAEEALRQVLYADDAPPNVSTAELERLFEVATAQKLRELQRKIEQLDATHAGAPPRGMVLADKPTPHNVHVFVRGNAENHGPEVPRQFLQILSGQERKPFEKGSGRLELARAIASTNNPLTARVIINRVWLQHFGVGLVKTPSDFGLRSEPPSHPELLDYLAARFMQEGWSLKKLHRWLMLSSVYQQSSDDNAEASRIDPNNQLLWRMNRQRLDFEAMRDSLLAISGALDPTVGGQAVDIISEPSAPRRTVYGYIDRQNLPALFRTFDFASPDTTSPQRFYTTVPQQALFLMNSPFVVQQAKKLVAGTDFKRLPSEEARVRFLYEATLQREPNSEEIRLANQFRLSQLCSPAAPPVGKWQYGYGELDETTRRVKSFASLPHFTGTAFQGGPAQPDPALGWVMLTESGGHPGNDLQHAAIRRWVAPREGLVRIGGELGHGQEQGDGVQGRIISSGAGELGHWVVHNKKAETSLEHVAVKRGETIDFVTECIANPSHDTFTWTTVIAFEADPTDTSAKPKQWDSQKDFVDSAREQKKPLSDWEKYAQVLLLSNELMFVD